MLRALKVFGLLAFMAAVTVLLVPDAEASPSITVEVLDATGHVIPGMVPPHVIIDMGNTVPLSTNWKKILTFRGTEFGTRLIAASGYVDAGFTDTTGAVFTLDVPAGLSGGTSIETEDILVKVVSVFTFGAPDAGASTTQLDIGVSGTLERFVKDADMLTAGRTLGSGTTSVKPRLVDSSPVTYRLTFTQSAKNLTTVTGGRVDIFTKNGNIIEAN